MQNLNLCIYYCIAETYDSKLKIYILQNEISKKIKEKEEEEGEDMRIDNFYFITYNNSNERTILDNIKRKLFFLYQSKVLTLLVVCKSCRRQSIVNNVPYHVGMQN